MHALHQQLKATAEQWAMLGAPALCERFVLRNGKEFDGAKRPKKYRRREMKQCFMNTTHLVSENGDLRYVEGFAMAKDFPFVFLHAWAIDANDQVIDVTLRNPENYLYMGVVLTRLELHKELRKLEVYGLMDQGMGLNAEWMFRVDKELQAEVEAVMATGPMKMRKWRELAKEKQDGLEAAG